MGFDWVRGGLPVPINFCSGTAIHGNSALFLVFGLLSGLGVIVRLLRLSPLFHKLLRFAHLPFGEFGGIHGFQGSLGG